jgi:hypothetical protein
MSHTTALKAVEMRNEEVLLAAAKTLELQYIGNAEHTLYDRSKHVGHAFKLKGWNYPVVVNTQTGVAAYDNFNGSWGQQAELDRFVQEYAAESNRRQAAAQGYLIQEEFLENGDLVQTFESAHTNY